MTTTPVDRAGEGCGIAICTRHLDVPRGSRPNYATKPESLIAAAQVVATERQTMAAAKNYSRQ